MSFLNLFSSFLMVSMLASAQPAPAIFDVLRSGRTAELSKLLKSGQAANARDRYGMAPLHYAAAYGSLGDVETLLAAGAAVNAATPAGATALMCATGDTAKLKALLAAGADVNMTAKSGATAVLAAAIRGNAEAVRMLLAAGADRGGRVGLIPNSPIRLGLTQLAYFSNDPELRGVLNEPQKKPDVRDLVAIPGSTPLAGAFVLKSFSMRPYSRPGVDEALRAALALGADPNADIRQLTRQLPPLALAATVNDPGAVRTLLQAGAEPNRAGTQGVTPLMLAASAEDPSVEIVELLLGAGAKVEAKDAQGRTAVDWALLQGESAVSRLLVAKGGAPRASLPLAPAVARPVREARNAMEVALQKLHASGAEFHRKTGCISCHHQSLPAVAGQLAQKAGVGVDAKGVAQATEASFSMWSPSRENFLMGNCSIMGFLGNVGYGLFGMAEQGVAPNEITDAAAAAICGLLWRGGRRWFIRHWRCAAYGRICLRRWENRPSGRWFGRASICARRWRRIRRGRRFGCSAWCGVAGRKGTLRRARLRKLQRPDGGWAQRVGMAPDAYATGQAVYALRVSGMPASSGVVKGAAGYLLRTQGEDGTWFVPSRTLGFQPPVESGFPHGRHEFISAAATAWAVMALGVSL